MPEDLQHKPLQPHLLAQSLPLLLLHQNLQVPVQQQ